MRRKSERTATKKGKASPEKKIEKVKRTRTRRKKQSESSEHESAEDIPSVPEPEITSVVDEKKPPPTPVKEDSPEETQEQVWHVKTAQSSSDSGEIQKLKLCLSRPPSTPERLDRSPRSKRKLSRATSSSDTPSNEGSEEKKKTRGRSKRSRESKDDAETSCNTSEDQVNETEADQTSNAALDVTPDPESENTVAETPVSTTGDESKNEVKASSVDKISSEVNVNSDGKLPDADTTVKSPKHDSKLEEQKDKSPQSLDVKPSEIIVNRDVSIDSTENNMETQNQAIAMETELPKESEDKEETSADQKVSITHGSNKECQETQDTNKNTEDINKTNVVESSDCVEKDEPRKASPLVEVEPLGNNIELSESTQSDHTQEDSVVNGQATPIVINRKRRWGSRPQKLTSQKSINISTDVLKDIIPDVKPVEFDEVIEEKKHKRIEITEKVERPVLPKIIIDNTEQVNKLTEQEEKKDKSVKSKDSHLVVNRRISIIKDNDSVLGRPPSPPRHKQSCILYITNLVRPFTLPQLKNLLQRTGRIVEDGFWIDRIKSKCYVKYETEDQAVETRHALHGVTWPVSNPKTLQVDFSDEEAFEKARSNEDLDAAPVSAIPGTVEDWLREQDLKRERGEVDKSWDRKAVREWDVGKNEKDKEKDKLRKDDRIPDKRRHRTPERSPEPARKFKKKEEEAPAKLLDDLFRKTKTTPCIYWLPLSAETIAIKEEQRRQHMLEHERRMQELRRRRH